MHVSVLDSESVHAVAVEELGLDPESLDLGAPEALAALVRRAAGIAAPCPHRQLRSAVLQALRGLVDMTGERRENWATTVDTAIEGLASYGDLLELPHEEGSAQLLYLAPPSFVILDGVIFLIGGQVDGADALPTNLRESVEYRNHTRRLRTPETEEVSEQLRALGWIELPRKLWLTTPDRVSAEELYNKANTALSNARTAGDVPGLKLLDPEKDPTYYPGRWVEPARRSGRFVARREQRYGADLWSFVEVSDGQITSLLDLPLDRRWTTLRGCDAAWHLQMAIDALSGRQQLYALRLAPPTGSVIVDFFSPIPLWARRRWDILGDEVPRARSLFAYCFPIAEFADVKRSLIEELWLSERLST